MHAERDSALEADLKESLTGRVLFAVMTTRRGGGMQTLSSGALERIKAGDTTAQEVLKNLG